MARFRKLRKMDAAKKIHLFLICVLVFFLTCMIVMTGNSVRNTKKHDVTMSWRDYQNGFADQVSYSHLKAGEKYVLYVDLLDSATNLSVLPHRVTHEFEAARRGSGSVIVQVNVDVNRLVGKKLILSETIKHGIDTVAESQKTIHVR